MYGMNKLSKEVNRATSLKTYNYINKWEETIQTVAANDNAW